MVGDPGPSPGPRGDRARRPTRKAFLAGGGAALLAAAGCGKDESTAPPPPEPALLRALAAERALAAAMGDRGLRRLAERSRDRARMLAAKLSELGARPHDAPAPADGGDPAARGRAVLEAYVTGLPALARRDQRELGADLLTAAAGDVALMQARLGAPPDDPFPGTPS